MSLDEKKFAKNNVLKKIAPPKKYAEKKFPPSPLTTIGREIFAPPPPSGSLPPPSGHK